MDLEYINLKDICQYKDQIINNIISYHLTAAWIGTVMWTSGYKPIPNGQVQM